MRRGGPGLRCCVALPRVGRLPVATPNHELSGCRSRLQDLSRLPSLRNAPHTCHGSHEGDEGDEGLLGLRDALGSSGHVLKDAVNPSAMSQRDHILPALSPTSLRILCGDCFVCIGRIRVPRPLPERVAPVVGTGTKRRCLPCCLQCSMSSGLPRMLFRSARTPG